jgi:hypothetical protein|eukprot:SAG25_NODE_131_length_14413_cov_29.573984_8_plen_100_part_00
MCIDRCTSYQLLPGQSALEISQRLRLHSGHVGVVPGIPNIEHDDLTVPNSTPTIRVLEHLNILILHMVSLSNCRVRLQYSVTLKRFICGLMGPLRWLPS